MIIAAILSILIIHLTQARGSDLHAKMGGSGPGYTIV